MVTGVIAIQLLNRKHERNIDVLEQETEPRSTFLSCVWVFIRVALFSLYSNTKRFQRLIYKRKWVKLACRESTWLHSFYHRRKMRTMNLVYPITVVNRVGSKHMTTLLHEQSHSQRVHITNPLLGMKPCTQPSSPMNNNWFFDFLCFAHGRVGWR